MCSSDRTIKTLAAVDAGAHSRKPGPPSQLPIHTPTPAKGSARLRVTTNSACNYNLQFLPAQQVHIR